MRAYGSDRVRAGDGAAMIISSRRDKGWKARVPKTLTSAEFPGTAVLWDDAYYEVVIAEPLAGGAVRYVMEPWRDSHTIRVSDGYDDESEAGREAAYQAAVAREKGRKTANLFGIFTGHLPAVVQEQLGSELGILPARLTTLSLILPVLFIAFALDRVVRAILEKRALPILLLALAIYLAIETVIRFNIAWMQSRPIGSAAGLIVYAAGYFLGLKRLGGVAPTAVQRGNATFTLPPSEDVALRDAVATRAPFMTLLSPAEQRILEQRYAFDYRAHASIVAGIILFVSAIGVVSSLSSGSLVSFVVALALAVEQIFRLVAFRRGPSGSFLAVLVRPFMRKLLR